MSNSIKLISQNFYKELSASPVTWLLGNVGDKIRIETTISVQIYAVSSQDSPFIVNKKDGVVGAGWFLDPQGQFTDFNIGDTVIYTNRTTGGNVSKTIADKVDSTLIQLDSDFTGTAGDFLEPNAVLSVTKPITSIKYKYNIIANNDSDTFISKIDGISEQLFICKNKSASDTSAESMLFQNALTWREGLIDGTTTKFDGTNTPVATIKGVAIDDGTTDGVYKSQFKIVHYTKINPYILYLMAIPPFKNDNSLKFISQIDALYEYTDPNFIRSQVFNTINGNVGWYGENFATGITNYSINGLGYKNAGLPVNSIVLSSSETIITFDVLNTVDSPFSNNNTKFVLGIFKVPADPGEYQGNNTLMDTNFLFDRAMQTVGSASVNGDNYSGALKALTSISAQFVSSSKITVTAKINFSQNQIDSYSASAVPKYELFFEVQKHTLDSDVSDIVTLQIDQQEFSINTSDPNMIVINNKFLRHPEADPVLEGVKLGFDNTSLTINSIATGTNPKGIAFDSKNNKIYVADSGSANSIKVYNSITNVLITTITGLNDVYDIAYDSFHNRIYVSERTPNDVLIIDCSNDTIITNISVGNDPLGIVYDPADKKIYVCNAIDGTVSVIDTILNTVIKTITVGTTPIGISYNSLENLIYVTNYTSNNIKVIDCSLDIVIVTIALIGGDNPTGIAFNPFSNKMYVNCPGAIVMKVIDCSLNTVVNTIATIGGRFSTYNMSDNTIITALNTTQMVVIDCSNDTILSTTTLTYGELYGFVFDINNYKIFITDNTSNLLYCLDSSFDVFPEDEIVACSNFYIERLGRTTDTIKLELVNSKIIAFDGTKEFELDQFIMPLGSIPLTGDTQQFDSQIQRSFHIPIGTIRKYIEVKRRNDLDIGTREYFSSNYPFLWRWEYWTEVLGVDSSFFNYTLPNNGFNEWWYHYKTGNWNLYYKIIIKASKNGVLQEYSLSNRIIPHDYNSNSLWTTKTITTWTKDEITQLVNGGDNFILGYDKTLVKAVFTKTATPLNYWVVIGMEIFEQGGINGKRRYSSRWVGDSDTWFTSIDGSGKVLTSISGNTVTAKVLIDNTLLPINMISYKITARIYEGIPIGLTKGLTTDDGVQITTDDGINIIID